MTLKQLLIILLARYRVVLFVMAGSLAVAFAIIARLPVNYTATAALLIDMRSQDPLSAMLAAGNRATQEDIVKSDRVALRVMKLLALERNEEVRQKWRDATGGKGAFEPWLAARLQRGLS